ncbi:MAG TPA: lipopolysaccharide biosynthesis protein [Terriglobales bacterium]|nr:lipopolysaccharide biosynthesis protein [Terriglobales bacterium]
MSEMSVPLFKARESARKWAGRGTLAIADQGLIAASNFLLAVLLGRQLRADAYGAWALAFEIFLLLAVLHAAFVLEPMTVFGAADYKECTREYLGTLLRVHSWTMIITGAALAGAAGVIYFAGSHELAKAMFGMAISTPIVLVFWVVRRTFYIELNPGGSVFGAAVYSAVLLAGLGVCYRFHLLSPFVAFVLTGIAGLVTIPVLLARIKPVFNSTNGPSYKDTASQHWTYGRWALGSSVASWATAASFYFLLTSFRGLSATGTLKALLNISSPIGTAFVALSLLTLPYAAKIQAGEDSEAMLKFTGRITVLYMGGTAMYFLVITLLRGPLLHLMYGSKYGELAGLIPWIALGMILRIGATAQAVTLRALKTPSLVFAAYGISLLAAVVVGVPATWAYGLQGTVVAYVVSCGSALVLAYAMLRRKLRARRAAEAELQPA